jgi:uncharacterized coiled-coil protein SlyX
MKESQIVDLQSKISHHEFLIEGLSKLVQEQGLAVYNLETKLAVIESKLRELTAEFGEAVPANQKPPHY